MNDDSYFPFYRKIGVAMGVVRISLISVLMMGAIAPYTFSDTIRAELEFIKRPPFSGVIYVVDDKNTISSITVDQKDHQFARKLQVGATGQKISFNNSDDVDHNIFANDMKNGASFDVGLMPPGSTAELEMSWKQDSLVRIGCKIHPKMRAYLANVHSNYFKILEFEKTKKVYKIEIDDVPSSLTALNIMMPGYEPIHFQIKTGEAKELPISKKGKQRGTLKISRKL